MIIPILIANAMWVGVFIFQTMELRRLRQQLRLERQNLWKERLDYLTEKMNAMPKVDPLPPRPSPTFAQISKTTQDVMQRMGWNPSGLAARIAPPSLGDPQPQRRSVCRNCGLPILWMGDPKSFVGEWRDHAGKKICDGIISGQSGSTHVPY